MVFYIPLSPYLFILSAKTLAINIGDNTNVKYIKNIGI